MNWKIAKILLGLDQRFNKNLTVKDIVRLKF